MKKQLGFLILLYIGMFSFGCVGMQEQKTATIELEGNPTTGYTWIYTMSPEGIVREISNNYIPDKTNKEIVGSGGKFVFTFEAISSGVTELAFSYLRVWEEGTPPIKAVIYKAVVDDKNNLTITRK